MSKQEAKTKNQKCVSLTGRAPRGRPPRCRGTIYLYVLATSLLVTILGLGALAAVRVQTRSERLAQDSAGARIYAVSAVEMGLREVKQNANWRTTWTNGPWLSNKTIGSGQLTLQGTDPVNGVLNDSPYDALLLTGTGTQGHACHNAQVKLVAVVQPLEALSTCLLASGQIQIAGIKMLTAVGAPVAANGDLANLGTLDGNVQALTASHTGTITGTLTVPGPSRAMPDATVFTKYTSQATAVPYAATIQNAVLGPGCNTLGVTDPNGFYVIDTGGRDITLQNCRVYGTLMILAAGHNVTVGDAIFMQNYRSDAPVLMVQGNLTLKPNSIGGTLSEAACNTNFNPLGAPYNGVTDSDKNEVYPDEIRGLVHVQGTLQLQQTARLVGAVICEGTVSITGPNCTLIYDPNLYAHPPKWYTCVPGMTVSAGSWQQIVN